MDTLYVITATSVTQICIFESVSSINLYLTAYADFSSITSENNEQSKYIQ